MVESTKAISSRNQFQGMATKSNRIQASGFQMLETQWRFTTDYEHSKKIETSDIH